MPCSQNLADSGPVIMPFKAITRLMGSGLYGGGLYGGGLYGGTLLT